MRTRAALPLWLEVRERLIREIGAGLLPDGARLPPERDMAAGLGVAVGTLRKALSDLAAKGLLERRQGSGNYVRRRTDVPAVYAMFRLELMRGGGLPTAKVLGIERHPKPDGVPRYGLSSEGHRIRRLRCLDGLPVALEEIWIDAGLVPSLRLDDLTEALYHSYRALFGIEIDRAEDRVGLAPVPEWSCNDFAPPPGAVVGFVERLAAAADGLGVEYSRTWFDPDRVRYVSRMGDGWR